MHGRKKLWIVGLICVLGVGVLVYRYILSVTLFPGCSNDVLSERVSPDGKYLATVFERNCGATTPYYRVVSLRRHGKRFDGNDEKAWVFEVKNQPAVALAWESQQQLNIVYSPGGDIRMDLARWENVQISTTASKN
jgi:hypothetical protein